MSDFEYGMTKPMVVVVLQGWLDVSWQTTKNFKYEDDTSRPGSEKMIRGKPSAALQAWSDRSWLISWITFELRR